MDAFIIALGSSFVMYSAPTWIERIRGAALFGAGLACGFCLWAHLAHADERCGLCWLNHYTIHPQHCRLVDNPDDGLVSGPTPQVCAPPETPRYPPGAGRGLLDPQRPERSFAR